MTYLLLLFISTKLNRCSFMINIKKNNYYKSTIKFYYLEFNLCIKGILFCFSKNILVWILWFVGDWGLGIGDWGLGMGDWAQSPIPNPQSPIPNPQSPSTI